MQKVYDDVKDFEQYGPDVEEYLYGADKEIFIGKIVSVISDAIENSKSEFSLPQLF